MKKITIVIPAFNEEIGIVRVLDQIPRRELQDRGYVAEIVVVDNNSTDATAEIALKRGALVVSEKMQGKGNALQAGFRVVSSDTAYIVMIDADDSYKITEILRLIEPLETNFCDVIVGSRLGGKMKKNSCKLQNRIANWGFTFIVRIFYHANVTDVLSGYIALKKQVLDEILPHIEAGGFAIEVDMIAKIVKLGFTIYSVPITYDERIGKSKLRPVKDGWKILSLIVKNMHWKPVKQLPNLQFPSPALSL